ncbi:matrixin family metalloprotease [Nocardioides sp. cx-173]|uniref:matrixin family metalloprotease n=1 Tax=Nocardioides sp. cx-173 TaxID=2898796 RepID=UPI001E42E79B|nr:matrixin family metalloprotease [Nocardioides sp. cx-173]MCD4526747.1 matrixin family metalloprotease [Nocardioides sp. cx-173]UGB42511.1 matrixin family metalloprotease [Nocardioides sp. cx-173]
MGGSGWSRRRADRQWQRDLLREIRAMETTDAGPDGADVTPIRGGLPRPPRRRRRGRERAERPPGATPDRRRTYFTIGFTVAVIVGLVGLNLSPGAAQVRSWLGIEDRLNDRVAGDGSGSYEFLSTRPGTDQPVAWSPCRPVEYVVNPDGAPDDWEDLLDDAVETISEATGLRFEDGGTTDDRDFEGRVDPSGRPGPVLIGWADADEVEGLAGDVAGLAGPMGRDDGMFTRYVTGRVVLDRDAFEEIEATRDPEAQQRAIIVHELGHLVGLDHVDDPNELMYPTAQVTSLGPGDLSGLAILGDAPCG